MHFITAAVFLPAAVMAAQVNFYWDANCAQYAGSSYTTPNGAVVGGPNGAQSMLFVNYSGCPVTGEGSNLDCLIYCKNTGCDISNAANFDEAGGTGKCKHFTNGVWAREVCRVGACPAGG